MYADKIAFLGVPFPAQSVSYKRPNGLKRLQTVKISLLPSRKVAHFHNINVGAGCKITSSVYCSASGWDALTSDSFNEKLESNELRLCLVGMSNCGKSHWSSQLCRLKRFHLICVDDQIEEEISPELAKLGYSGIDGMAKWMGFPSDEQFTANQDRYLMHEERITSRAVPDSNRNTVLDTTGSVVYLSDGTLGQLRADYLVIHLEANDDMLEMMTENYFKTPKPVVWGDAFNSRELETPMESMRRCYPSLLRKRRERYAKLAHITVPAAVSLSRETKLEDFLEYVRRQL